jgi:hypothetical protein
MHHCSPILWDNRYGHQTATESSAFRGSTGVNVGGTAYNLRSTSFGGEHGT